MPWGVHVEPVGARSSRKVISCVPNCIFPLMYLKAVYFSVVHLASVVPNQSNFFFIYYYYYYCCHGDLQTEGRGSKDESNAHPNVTGSSKML